MTTVLITGVSGQDGGYLAERLLRDGVDVHGIVRRTLAPDELAALQGTSLHTADLTDVDAVTRVIMEIKPDHIYNLAATTSVARSWTDPAGVGMVAGIAVAGLLQAAWRLLESGGNDRLRFVQASSAEIFGDPASSPQNEQTPIVPVNPYGAAKAYAHQMVGIYRARGLPASSVVLYNHESPRRPTTFVSRKISSAVAAIAAGRCNELVLGNLEARRDWGWAPDYVDALVRAMEHDPPSDYVIATGQPHSVRDFVDAAFRRVGIDDWARFVRVDPAFVRPVDAVELSGDAGRASRELKWAPTVPFDEMIARMVDADSDRLSAT